MRTERPSWVTVALWIVCAGIVTLIVGGGAWMANTINELRAENAARQATLDLLVRDYADLYRQAQAEGVDPESPTPGEVSQQAGPRGEAGPQGPVGPQGPQGLRGETGSTGAPGPAGPTGPTGPPGPAGRDGSTGATGSSGSDGAAGADGATGPAGPPGPVGPAGTPGATGPQGEQGTAGPVGVGIASVTCQDDGTWLITFTDSSTQTTPGPCRVDLMPE